MRVFVYFNLHKKLFSIKSLDGNTRGLVIGHEKSVSLTNVTFKVSEAGRQRVLREKRKNVHAGVVGELSDNILNIDTMIEVTYDPYKYNSFVVKSSLEPIYESNQALLINKQIYVEL